ncbi:MAG: regulatory protein RecX [Patulibacter minatonensis]
MTDPTIAALAAKIAALEAVDPGRSRRPRARSDEDARAGIAPADSVGVGHAAAPLVGDVELPSGGVIDASLPSRDVDDERGPSVVDAGGQHAHDESLGVGQDGRPLDVGEDGPSRGRPKAPKPAQLAFSEAMPYQRAIDLAFKFVAKRERTTKQLRDHLAGKDCEPAEIEGALAELRRHGFIDDARYAKIYAEDKRRLQGWGARRIRLELGRAGIDREVLDALFADDEAELQAPSELEAALEILRRKRPDLTDPKVKQRMAGMLARRGIASGTVFAALREYERGGDD